MQGINEPAPLLPSDHTFADGVYYRRTFLPKGSIVIGKIHAKPTNNIVVGSVLVGNPEQPEKNGFLVGFQMFESPGGSRRFVYAIADTYWVTSHRTNKTDLKSLEEDFTVKSYDKLSLEEKECLGAL